MTGRSRAALVQRPGRGTIPRGEGDRRAPPLMGHGSLRARRPKNRKRHHQRKGYELKKLQRGGAALEQRLSQPRACLSSAAGITIWGAGYESGSRMRAASILGLLVRFLCVGCASFVPPREEELTCPPW